MTPIPVSEENSVAFHLHLNILGEQKVMNGPVEIGESISIQCVEPGNKQHLKLLKDKKGNSNCYCFYIGYTFDMEVSHNNRIYPVKKLIGMVSKSLLAHLKKLKRA